MKTFAGKPARPYLPATFKS